MEGLKIFENTEFGKIRTVLMDGELWFVGKDVARALGYSNHRDALYKHVDSEDKGESRIATPSGEQTMTTINESGVYSLIMSSKLPSAKRFKRWVTSEVLPAIRKTGAYGGYEGNLLEITGQLAQAATMIAQTATSVMQSADRLADAVMRLSERNTGICPETGAEADVELMISCFSGKGNKIESFPPEITERVNRILEEMIRQQNLNFSLIARFCTLNGYPISQPTAKRYFQKHYDNFEQQEKDVSDRSYLLGHATADEVAEKLRQIYGNNLGV